MRGMGLFSILRHKLFCIPVFKEMLHCRAVCDVKSRIESLPWVQFTACFDNFEGFDRQIKSEIVSGKTGKTCALLVGR